MKKYRKRHAKVVFCDDPSNGDHLSAEQQVSYSDDAHLMTITSVESSGTNDVKSLRSVSVNKYEWISSDCGNVTRALQMPGALAQTPQETRPSAP